MKKNRLALLTCLAIALSGPAVAASGGTTYYGGASGGSGSGQSSDDKGGSSQSGGGQSGNSGSGSSSTQPGDDKGGANQAGDDKGGANQAGDDKGGSSSTQAGDDRGNGGQSASFQRNDAGLAVTTAGSSLRLSGNVDIRAAGNQQRLKLEIEGNFADGTQFQVLANGLAIGSITGRLNHGEFEVELENGATLPGGLLPSAVTSVEVRDLSGNSLLVGRFAALPGVITSPVAGVTKIEKSLARVSASATTVAAAGTVELRSQGAQQELEVRVDAAVADGTVWTVSANGIQIGTLKFRLQVAEFKLQSENPLPAGLGSLAAISTVTISDASGAVLSTTLK